MAALPSGAASLRVCGSCGADSANFPGMAEHQRHQPVRESISMPFPQHETPAIAHQAIAL